MIILSRSFDSSPFIVGLMQGYIISSAFAMEILQSCAKPSLRMISSVQHEIKIQNFSFQKMHLKISSAKWQPFCPGRYELTRLRMDKMAVKLQTINLSVISLLKLTGEFPAQMASNAENVSIWWRHHESSRYFGCKLTLYAHVIRWRGRLFHTLSILYCAKTSWCKH